jgi:MscS family membrane protein
MNKDITRSIANEATVWMNDVIFLVPNWKWLGAAAGIVIGLVIKSLSKHFIRQLKTRYSQRQNLSHTAQKFFSYWLRKDVHIPLSWLLAAAVWHLSLQTLAFHESFERIVVLALHLLTLVNLLRLSYMAVDAFGDTIEDWAAKANDGLDSQLAPFATKVLKIVVITLGVLLSLQSLGFNVGAVLAGLGIGSLALALAAQDTAANLFGSITIILDRPFHRGDYIKVGDTEGIVEEVGFRSTRIRTLYKSVVTVPNSTMAKERVDNLGVRPSRRVRHQFGISAETPPSLVQDFINALRLSLKSHPLISKNEITVYLQSMGDSDLKILLNCFVLTSDADVELGTQQEILLQILSLSQQMGVELPYPTQSLHLVSLPKVQATSPSANVTQNQ